MRCGRAWAIGALAAVLSSSCDGSSCARPTTKEPCAASATRHEIVSRLYDPRVDDTPLLVRADLAKHLDAPATRALLDVLTSVTQRGLEPLDVETKVVVQNDLWGLWQRARALDDAHALRAPLVDAAARAVRKFTTVDEDIAPSALPHVVARVLPARDGWREREIEVPSTQHERLFGLRRVFRVIERDRVDRAFEGVVPATERALFSTLLAIGPDGSVRRTDVVGDLEVLRFDGDVLVAARLFELPRERLACGEVALVETDVALRVPGLGANGHLAEFDAPVPLSRLPCATCHDSAEPMSLPSSTLRVGERHEGLLESAREEVAGNDLMGVEVTK